MPACRLTTCRLLAAGAPITKSHPSNRRQHERQAKPANGTHPAPATRHRHSPAFEDLAGRPHTRPPGSTGAVSDGASRAVRGKAHPESVAALWACRMRRARSGVTMQPHRSAENARAGRTPAGPHLSWPPPRVRHKSTVHQRIDRAQGPPAPEAGAGATAGAAAADAALAAARASKAFSISSYGLATRLLSLTRSFFSSCE